MATKVENLSVTSVDLVDQGANPDAHICLFKRREPRGGKTEEVMDSMKIDKSKMTKEERATLAEFEKKYGVPDGNEPEAGGTKPPAPEDGVGKGAEPAPVPDPPPAPAPVPAPTPAPQPQETQTAPHPEVAKALTEFKELTKRQNAEIEELKKSLEIERLTATAQKYEVLGKKAPELAAKLYELKKAGGTVYKDYVELLDESLAVQNKSGLFAEIGKNTQGSAGAADAIAVKAAELAKSAGGGMSAPEAIVKAFEENPELAARYEAEYMGR